MGFFSSLGSAISNTWNKAKNIVEKVVNNTVEVVDKASNWIKENVFNISETPEYNPNTASVDETKKINELLEKCITNYSEQAEEFDVMTQKIIESYFSKVKKELTEINKNEVIIKEHIFDMFDFQAKEISNKLNNVYSKYIAEVFSLNNNELLDILSLKAGNRKQRKLNNLAISTLEKANEQLLSKLDKFLKEQQDFISDELEKYINNLDKEFEKAIVETEKIKKDMKKGEEKINKRIKDYNYLLNKISKLRIE